MSQAPQRVTAQMRREHSRPAVGPQFVPTPTPEGLQFPRGFGGGGGGVLEHGGQAPRWEGSIAFYERLVILGTNGF